MEEEAVEEDGARRTEELFAARELLDTDKDGDGLEREERERCERLMVVLDTLERREDLLEDEMDVWLAHACSLRDDDITARGRKTNQ